jgi:hypothetical protein
MNNSSGREHGPRQPWPRRAQAAGIITVMAAAVLAAACSASPSSTGSGGSPNAGGPANSSVPVAYSRCIRSHGIPKFPDPNSSGQIPKEEILQLGVSTSVLQTAQRACQRLWPYQAPSQAQQRQQLTEDLKFARCMRSHGVPNLPDPTTGPDGPYFAISVSRDGFNPHSPQILAKAHECQHVLPAGSRLPSVTVSP